MLYIYDILYKIVALNIYLSKCGPLEKDSAIDIDHRPEDLVMTDYFSSL